MARAWVNTASRSTGSSATPRPIAAPMPASPQSKPSLGVAEKEALDMLLHGAIETRQWGAKGEEGDEEGESSEQGHES